MDYVMLGVCVFVFCMILSFIIWHFASYFLDYYRLRKEYNERKHQQVSRHQQITPTRAIQLVRPDEVYLDMEQAFHIIPEELWDRVIKDMCGGSITSLILADGRLAALLHKRKPEFMMSKAMPELSDYLEANELTNCRLVCKRWDLAFIDMINADENNHRRNIPYIRIPLENVDASLLGEFENSRIANAVRKCNLVLTERLRIPQEKNAFLHCFGKNINTLVITGSAETNVALYYISEISKTCKNLNELEFRVNMDVSLYYHSSQFICEELARLQKVKFNRNIDIGHYPFLLNNICKYANHLVLTENAFYYATAILLPRPVFEVSTVEIITNVDFKPTQNQFEKLCKLFPSLVKLVISNVRMYEFGIFNTKRCMIQNIEVRRASHKGILVHACQFENKATLQVYD